MYAPSPYHTACDPYGAHGVYDSLRMDCEGVGGGLNGNGVLEAKTESVLCHVRWCGTRQKCFFSSSSRASSFDFSPDTTSLPLSSRYVVSQSSGNEHPARKLEQSTASGATPASPSGIQLDGSTTFTMTHSTYELPIPDSGLSMSTFLCLRYLFVFVTFFALVGAFVLTVFAGNYSLHFVCV